jgi:hypothetical protein
METTRFDIQEQTADVNLQQIHAMTQGFAGINVEYIAKMTENITKRKRTWTGFIDAPDEVAIIKQVIGKNGVHLKNITAQYAVDLIWHDHPTKKFFVWGAKQHLISALYGLQRQINRFTLKQAHFNNMALDLANLQVTGAGPDARAQAGAQAVPDIRPGKRDDIQRDANEEPDCKRQKM